ncbi:hypothetical protein SLEP1_g1895 [Rubroshorea leprosula]|nr:hypothetical protein SLEP1_g1895 [Rubroshorea leprosula]
MAQSLGVDVKMITDDQLAIAKETGRRLGMGTNRYPSSSLPFLLFLGRPSSSLFEDKDASIAAAFPINEFIETADGFAGVLPEHKYEIVKRLQERKHICGMTGDGDAPALKKADIGIAVANASDAARSASDIVLTEPGLSVIISAVLTSRAIYQRMKNYTIYAVAATIHIVFSFLIIALVWKFDFAPFMVLIIAILNDGTVMTISRDRVKPSSQPDSWKLKEIFTTGIVLGGYLAHMTLVFFWAIRNTKFFSDMFSVILPDSVHINIVSQFNSDGLFLSQTQYVRDLLDKSGMVDCKAVSTPLTPKHKLQANDSPLCSDASLYRSLVGALQYLTFTRPDIAFAVNQVCQYMHVPTENHFLAVKRILRYLKGTMHHGLQLYHDSLPSLNAFTDADWAGCLDTRRSTSGFCLFYGRSLISWSSKKQSTVARSRAEAEYRALANAVAEVLWVKQLLAELHLFLPSAPTVFCDNLSAIYMTLNPIQHQRTKHIEIDIHFVREKVASRIVTLQHVSSSFQRADILTKALSAPAFCSQRSNLSVVCNPAQIAGG